MAAKQPVGARLGQLLRALLLLALSLTWSSQAFAYCRATTCDPLATHCVLDEHGCVRDGQPLHWVGGCLTLSVASEGRAVPSPLGVFEVGSDSVKRATERALQTWSAANCGPRHEPALVYSVAQTDTVREVSPDRLNVVRFREQDWPYHAMDSSLALTTLTFVAQTGEIVDADIEINAAGREFTEDRAVNAYNLDEVLLHEVGHLLGLGHSDAMRSAMLPNYAPQALGEFLSADDELAVCATYPPTRVAQCQESGSIWVPCETLQGCRVLAAWILGLCWTAMGAVVGLRLQYLGTRRRFRLRFPTRAARNL